MNVEEVWRSLEQAAPTSPGLRIRRRIASESGLDLFLAVDKPRMARSFLWLLPTSVSLTEEMPEQSRGIYVTLEADASEDRSWLRLTLADQAFDGVFAALVADLTAAVLDPPAGTTSQDAFLRRLERWRQLLARVPGEVLGREAQRGLFGELWVLRKYLLEAVLPEAALIAWTGPEGATQDFQLAITAIEVKTTAGLMPEHLTISNERQLEAGRIPHLFLLHVCLDERHAGGDETLPGIVDDIRARIGSAGVPLFRFEEKLHDAGFREEHRPTYLEQSYVVAEERIYGVGSGFPCITREILPHGVGNVVYDVAIAACLPFLVSDGTLKDALSGADQ